MEEYVAIEINTLVRMKPDDKEKVVVPIVMNRQNINYYRPWSDPDGIKTVVYFKDTARGLVIECGYDHLRLQLAKSKILDKMQLDKLTFDQLERVALFVQNLRTDHSKESHNS